MWSWRRIFLYGKSYLLEMACWRLFKWLRGDYAKVVQKGEVHDLWRHNLVETWSCIRLAQPWLHCSSFGSCMQWLVAGVCTCTVLCAVWRQCTSSYCRPEDKLWFWKIYFYIFFIFFSGKLKKMINYGREYQYWFAEYLYDGIRICICLTISVKTYWQHLSLWPKLSKVVWLHTNVCKLWPQIGDLYKLLQ